ncbi:NACHT domain-containing protein [Microbacterium sp. NPDC090281]|uniref:NACHT domain-containing protein n=1 Tax=Microbacterium sp. NPDC090281 TaxID=3364208 RepID=UPI0038073E82
MHVVDRLVTTQSFGHSGEYAPEAADASPEYYLPLASLKDRTASLVLGEPGIGKSTAMRHLFEQWSADGYSIELLNLRECTSARNVEIAFETLDTIEDARLLLLDSVDEAPTLINNFVPFLRKKLTGLTNAGWRVIATCRTAESVVALHDLFDELEEGASHVLLPLSRSDVEAVAHSMGIEAQTFTSQLASRRLDSLAAVPFTLHLLCEIYLEDGSFPDSRADLFDRAIHLSLGHNSVAGYTPPAPSTANPLLQLATAERLAGFATFAGTTDFALYLAGTPSEATQTELLVGMSPVANRSVNIENTDFQDVLRTSLFASSGTSQSRFAHRRLQDFLAARFLIHHEISRSRLESILIVPDGEVIPPQMADVATWLVALDGDAFRWLVELDPISLVRNKIALDVPELAGFLVELLLDRAETVERAITWRDELSGLEHPDLQRQLQSRLRTSDEIERIVSLRILRDSYVPGLEDELAAIVSDRSSTPRERELSASVILRQRLARHLDRSDIVTSDYFANDRSGELRGLVMRALWPEEMTPLLLTELLWRPQEHVLGSYSMFLSSLSDSLTDEYAAAILSWASTADALDTRWWSGRGSLRQLVQSAMATRLKTITGDGDVPADVAAALHAQLTAGHRRLPIRRDEMGSEARRALIRSLGPLFADDRIGWFRLQGAGFSDGSSLVERDDLKWVLSVAQGASGAQRMFWVELVDRFLDSERPEDMELIWGTRDTSLWTHFRYRFDPIRLDSEHAAKAREQFHAYHEEASATDQVEAEGMNADDYTAGIRERLGESRDDTTRFWDLARWLDVDLEHAQFRYEFTPDLLSTNASQHLDATTRTEVCALAAEFLRNSHVAGLSEVSPSEYSFVAVAAYQALHTLLRHDETLLNNLIGNDWARLNTPILEFPQTGAEPEVREQLLQRSFSSNPGALRGAVHEHLRRVSRGASLSNYLTGLTPYIDDSMETEIRIGIRNRQESRRELASMYLEHDEDGALLWMRRRVRISSSAAELATILEVTLRVNPIEGIRFIESLLNDRADVAKVTLPLFAQAERLESATASGIDVQTRARLYVGVAALFPPGESWPSGVHPITPQQDLAEWRDELLTGIVRDGTRDSLAAASAIAGQVPGAVTSYAFIRAREAYRLAGWFPLAVSELHSLLERTDTRLVRSSRDAKLIVMDALTEIEEWLRGETPQAFALWNLGTDLANPKDENHISDWYCHGLRLLLARSGLVINREVEVVNRTGRGVGKRNDLRVEVRDPDSGHAYIVVVEVKGIWNSEVKTSLRAQLADDYLAQAGLTHGVYLVVMFPPSQITVEARAVAARRRSKGLRSHLDSEAASLGPTLDISAVYHDASLPS